MVEDEPIVEEEDPDPYAQALALAGEYFDEVDSKKLSICVRCGDPLVNRGNRPWPDENGVPWLKCPKRCEPPEGADASCVPMDERRHASVFDPTTLDPGDALYQEPDDPEEDEPEDTSADSDVAELPPELAPRIPEAYLRPRARPQPRGDVRIRWR